MRQPRLARILLVLAVLLSGALVFAAQAAPAAQSAGQGLVPAFQAPEQGAPPARIAVVHAAPFGANIAATNVTVVATVLGQDFLITNSFRFGDVVPYVTVPSATYMVKIYAGSLTLPIPAGTTPVKEATVNLAAGTDYTAVAIGRNTSTYPIDILLLNDTTAEPGSGLGKVRVLHAAPFADAGPAATGVDILTDAGNPIGVNNLLYPTATDFVTFPAATYNLKVVPTGQPSAPPIIDLDPFTLSTNDRVTAIAVGLGTAEFPARVLLLPFIEREPARVRLVHAAPFAAGSATVTVRINGQVFTNSFDFREITPYTTLPAGIYNVEIFAGNTVSGTPAIATPLVLQDGQSYTVVAMGSGSAPFPLKLRQLVDNNTVPTGVRLRVLHAAPFAATVAGTAVDVRLQDGTAIPELGNIVYDDLRSVLLPSGGTLDLKVVPAGQATGTPIIDPGALTFANGSAFTVIAVGGPNAQAAGLLLLDDLSVTQAIYLPLIAKR